MALDAQPTFKVTPSQVKAQLASNYVSYYDFTSQYVPDTGTELAQIYGNQSISGMLHLLGAEYGSNADKYIWSENGRLHTIYNAVTRSGNIFTQANHVFRQNELIHISGNNNRAVGLIISVDQNTFTVAPYKTAGLPDVGAANITCFVFGSEFQKGTGGQTQSLEQDFTILENSPIIQKDIYEVSGSDATNIGWIQTPQGYYWYLYSEYQTRRRFEDRLELSQLLSERAQGGSIAQRNGRNGTEGLFESIRSRGNVFSGLATNLADWDNILRRFDAQGKIQDYMFYVDRDQSLAIDDLLGTLNAGYSSGISYGIFENSEEMAVNLGFVGFRRGSYNFFKSDYKLLNDPTLLGGVADADDKIRGILIPVGTKEVYDNSMGAMGANGEKHMMPFLHTKYKESPTESRKYKTWITGSVGGVYNSDLDAMQIHQLSERGLCTVGANNFMLFEGA